MTKHTRLAFPLGYYAVAAPSSYRTEFLGDVFSNVARSHGFVCHAARVCRGSVNGC